MRLVCFLSRSVKDHAPLIPSEHPIHKSVYVCLRGTVSGKDRVKKFSHAEGVFSLRGAMVFSVKQI